MTPLLQQAREALQALIDSHAKEPNFHEVLAARKALASLDAYEAMSDYDKAVQMLADNGMMDGWVCQNYKGRTSWSSSNPMDAGSIWEEAGVFATGLDFTILRFNIPACPDWRTSLREIRAGRVVPQGERGRG